MIVKKTVDKSIFRGCAKYLQTRKLDAFSRRLRRTRNISYADDTIDHVHFKN